MSERYLTPRQQLFVLEYLKDLNATQACLRAGYCEDNPDNAGKVGPELLGKTRIQAAIQEAMEDRARNLLISNEAILSEIHKLAFFDPADVLDAEGSLLPMDEIPVDVRKAIASIDIHEVTNKDGEIVGIKRKVKFYSKERMLELLGRHKVLFADKTIHEGKVTLEELVAGSDKKKEAE